MLKRVDESRHPCRTPTVVQNQSPVLLLKRTALVALSLEVFDDSDKVGAYVVLLHGCSHSCMPNPVEGLGFYKDMIEVLLVPEIFVFHAGPQMTWAELSVSFISRRKSSLLVCALGGTDFIVEQTLCRKVQFFEF